MKSKTWKIIGLAPVYILVGAGLILALIYAQWILLSLFVIFFIAYKFSEYCGRKTAESEIKEKGGNINEKNKKTITS